MIHLKHDCPAIKRAWCPVAFLGIRHLLVKTKITVIIDALFVLDVSAISVTYTCMCITVCASMILYLGSVSCCHGDSPNQTGWMRKECMFTQGSAKFSTAVMQTSRKPARQDSFSFYFRNTEKLSFETQYNGTLVTLSLALRAVSSRRYSGHFCWREDALWYVFTI